MNIPIHKVWPEMESLLEKGYTKNIGVSNFSVQSLWDLLSYCKVKPVVNQIELHPLNTQVDLIKYCFDNGILPVGYTPVIRANEVQRKRGAINALESDLVKALAAKHQATPSQVLLSWGLSRGYAIIPKSANLERQRENISSFNVHLT